MTLAPPYAMLAELTHRCPLACPYCSNPVELAHRKDELGTAEWLDVFRQAAALGVLQVHLSGGEPASRRDLVELARGAAEAGLYTNLITSGVGLNAARVEALAAAGLDHVQLSLQGADAEMTDLIGGYRGGFARKMAVAGLVRAAGLPLTLNFVMHRKNVHQLPRAFEIAVELGARRMEVATVQFHGWALLNRAALMPTRAQAREASRLVADARTRLAGALAIDYVPADYHANYPKPCMNGWGSTGLNVTPDGLVLPCHAAQTIAHLRFDSVRDRRLEEIWTEGAAFNAYRGVDWMSEPCRSCERRAIDFGGCRCQAMALTGDAAATDPVCVKSPHHARLARDAEDFADSGAVELSYRREPGSAPAN